MKDQIHHNRWDDEEQRELPRDEVGDLTVHGTELRLRGEQRQDPEERERVILSQAEVEIARSFATASQSYQNNPVALQLRAMNMLYEGLKERGGLMGAAAMGQAHLAASAKPLPPGQD